MMVYRFEKGGCGPYGRIDGLTDAHSSATGGEHPGWAQDPALRKHYQFYSPLAACESRSDLFAWFADWLLPLREEKYQLMTYEAEDTKVLIGKGQVVFDGKFAKVVDIETDW